MISNLNLKKYIKFYRYLLPFWRREVIILFLSGVSVVLGLINPFLSKLIIDKAYANKDLKLFLMLIVIGGVIFILNGIINGFSKYLNRYIELRINFDLNCKVFKKLQNLSYGFFQNTSTGKHLYNISYDIQQVTQFIANVLPQAISLIPRSFLIFVILLYLNWKIALFALALTPFLYLVPYYFAKRLKKVLKIWIENSESIFERLQEVLSHIQLIKAFGKEKSQIRHYIRSLVENIRFGLINTRLEVAGSFANTIANRLVLGLIIFYGGYQVIKGEITLGSLTAITIYLTQLSGLQSSLAQFFQQISLGFISCGRLNTILDADAGFIKNKQTEEVIFSKGKIEFRNVTFGYKSSPCRQGFDKQYKIVLEKLSFFIEGGSCIGLVGPSGCGKTTIVNLILRLYEPLGGEILVDGCNISIIKPRFLYEQIGVVLQEPYLWNDTVENNIRYGKKEASLKEVKEAAKVACIDDFIITLTQGYNTIIGENACKISEGQKQRIAIARAIIKKPQILILDEALSSVDVETEGRIIGNIRSLLNDSTIIVISHRLSTISRMDLIYFLENSKDIIIDTHQELLRQNIRYQDYLAQHSTEEKVTFEPF